MSEKIRLEINVNDLLPLYMYAQEHAQEAPEMARLYTVLKAKYEALERRQLYSQYKQGGTPEEREKARHAYTDRAGIHPDWKW